MIVCALVTDLMDRSKIASAIEGVQFSLVQDADVVIVDLAKGVDIADVRAKAPNARVVGYGPHVENLEQSGADETMPRSKFFGDPAAAVGRR